HLSHEADFAERHYPSRFEIARQHLDDGLIHALVVALLQVQTDGADVTNTVLPRPVAREAEEEIEVIDEGADRRPRLALPEGRLAYRDDAGERHPLVVVRHPRGHVNVRVEQLHGVLFYRSARASATSSRRRASGSAPAARRLRIRSTVPGGGWSAISGQRSAPTLRPACSRSVT